MTLNALESLSGLAPVVLAYAMAVVLLAGIVRGYTGFGFSALVVLSVSLVMAPARLVPVLLLLEIVASVHMLPRVWRHIDWYRFGVMMAGIAVSTPVGIYLLATLPEDLTRLVISVVVLVIAVLIARGVRLPDSGGPGLPLATGLTAGAVNGATGVGGLVMVVMFMATRTAMETTRAMLVALLFATDVIGVGAAVWRDLIDARSLWLTALLILPLVAGVALGGRLFLGATPARFRKLVLLMLVILSLGGMVRALW